jgi:hypothetical protein
MLPQLGIGALTPTPRNDRVASNTIAVGISSEARTVICAIRLGSRSTNMIRSRPAPSERAASTNSFSLSEMTWPRRMRPVAANEKNAMTRMVIDRLATTEVTWKVVASTIATSRYGSARVMSMNRARTVSVAPPANPDSTPNTTPKKVASSEAEIPTTSEIRAP